MTEFDEIIRESLRAQVLEAPPLNAPAARAIGTARRIRRRRPRHHLRLRRGCRTGRGRGCGVMRHGSPGHYPVAASTVGPTEAQHPVPPRPRRRPHRRPSTRLGGLTWRSISCQISPDGGRCSAPPAEDPAKRTRRPGFGRRADGRRLAGPDRELAVAAHARRNRSQAAQPVDEYALAPDRSHLAGAPATGSRLAT
jgi:hypothetical protein